MDVYERQIEQMLIQPTYPVSFYFAMPSRHTFLIKPLRAVAERFLAAARVSVDPFSGKTHIATHTNDLDRHNKAQHAMCATDFLRMLRAQGVKADLVFLDPCYSPTQTARCYKRVRRRLKQADSQNGRLLRECRELVRDIAAPGCVVITCGWNSQGMGKASTRVEHHQVRHGGAHNDTICVVDRL